MAPYPYLAWKDTINTRAGQTVRLKIKQSQKGLRMYHCHILEHEDLGMMGQFELVVIHDHQNTPNTTTKDNIKTPNI